MFSGCTVACLISIPIPGSFLYFWTQISTISMEAIKPSISSSNHHQHPKTIAQSQDSEANC